MKDLSWDRQPTIVANGGLTCAHKKGETVEPAGGETGVPHCLAEAHKLLEAALFP